MCFNFVTGPIWMEVSENQDIPESTVGVDWINPDFDLFESIKQLQSVVGESILKDCVNR